MSTTNGEVAVEPADTAGVTDPNADKEVKDKVDTEKIRNTYIQNTMHISQVEDDWKKKLRKQEKEHSQKMDFQKKKHEEKIDRMKEEFKGFIDGNEHQQKMDELRKKLEGKDVEMEVLKGMHNEEVSKKEEIINNLTIDHTKEKEALKQQSKDREGQADDNTKVEMNRILNEVNDAHDKCNAMQKEMEAKVLAAGEKEKEEAKIERVRLETKFEKLISEITERNEAEVRQLKKEHNELIEKKDEEMKQKQNVLDAKDKEQRGEIADIRRSHQEEVKSLKDEHAAGVKNERVSLKEKEDDMKQEHAALLEKLQKQIDELRQGNETSEKEIRADSEKKLQKLGQDEKILREQHENDRKAWEKKSEEDREKTKSDEANVKKELEDRIKDLTKQLTLREEENSTTQADREAQHNHALQLKDVALQDLNKEWEGKVEKLHETFKNDMREAADKSERTVNKMKEDSSVQLLEQKQVMERIELAHKEDILEKTREFEIQAKQQEEQLTRIRGEMKQAYEKQLDGKEREFVAVVNGGRAKEKQYADTVDKLKKDHDEVVEKLAAKHERERIQAADRAERCQTQLQGDHTDEVDKFVKQIKELEDHQERKDRDHNGAIVSIKAAQKDELEACRKKYELDLLEKETRANQDKNQMEKYHIDIMASKERLVDELNMKIRKLVEEHCETLENIREELKEKKQEVDELNKRRPSLSSGDCQGGLVVEKLLDTVTNIESQRSEERSKQDEFNREFRKAMDTKERDHRVEIEAKHVILREEQRQREEKWDQEKSVMRQEHSRTIQNLEKEKKTEVEECRKKDRDSLEVLERERRDHAEKLQHTEGKTEEKVKAEEQKHREEMEKTRKLHAEALGHKDEEHKELQKNWNELLLRHTTEIESLNRSYKGEMETQKAEYKCKKKDQIAKFDRDLRVKSQEHLDVVNKLLKDLKDRQDRMDEKNKEGEEKILKLKDDHKQEMQAQEKRQELEMVDRDRRVCERTEQQQSDHEAALLMLKGEISAMKRSLAENNETQAKSTAQMKENHDHLILAVRAELKQEKQLAVADSAREHDNMRAGLEREVGKLKAEIAVHAGRLKESELNYREEADKFAKMHTDELMKKDDGYRVEKTQYERNSEQHLQRSKEEHILEMSQLKTEHQKEFESYGERYAQELERSKKINNEHLAHLKRERHGEAALLNKEIRDLKNELQAEAKKSKEVLQGLKMTHEEELKRLQESFEKVNQELDASNAKDTRTRQEHMLTISEKENEIADLKQEIEERKKELKKKLSNPIDWMKKKTRRRSSSESLSSGMRTRENSISESNELFD